MEPTLSNFYDGLKKEISSPAPTTYNVGTSGMNFDAQQWKDKAMHHCKELKDKCRKHLLVDMYCKIIPLDKDYVDGHMGQMNQDVDSMLAAKGMTPTQYFQSCFESTHAPFVKFLIESTELIGREYMEAREEELKDAQEDSIELSEPVEPEVDDEPIDSQLVDIKSDTEYNDFVEQLKKKTIDKIVDDVSKIIAGEKEEKDMTFDPVEESAVITAMDYIQKNAKMEYASAEATENMLGLAIRESVLHEFDKVFNLQGNKFTEYATRVRLGKGYVITESAINAIKNA